MIRKHFRQELNVSKEHEIPKLKDISKKRPNIIKVIKENEIELMDALEGDDIR